MLYLDCKFLNVEPYVVASSVLCYTIKTYFYGILADITLDSRR